MLRDWLGAEGFAVDASLTAADANKQRSVPGAEWEAKDEASRSVREYLSVLDDAAFGAASPLTPKPHRELSKLIRLLSETAERLCREDVGFRNRER